MEILAYLSTIFIGITLGLIGGGGSILSLPILVYLFHISPKEATTYSLFIVGITAFIGAIKQYKLGNLNIESAIPFAIPSLLTLLLVRKLILPYIPSTIFKIGALNITSNMLLMILFSLLMIASAYFMIKKTNRLETKVAPNIYKLIFIGLLVGIVTGFLGAGGGFLIIPALVYFTGISIRKAIGTSLLIIAFNSLFGFFGDITQGIKIDIHLLTYVSILAVVGLFIGTIISKKIDSSKLKPIFGWFILIMGIFVIIQETILK